MFGSQTLEVIIGIISIFILMSIIATVIREGLESWLKTRAAFLERGIQQLLHDESADGLVSQLYNHPHISSLFFGGYTAKNTGDKPNSMSKGGELPSYIPTKNFAQALMDLAARGPVATADGTDSGTAPITVENIRANVAKLNNPAVQRVVLTALDAAEGDLGKVQTYLEHWYDSSMDRVSGWYRRSSQWVLFWIGLFIAVALNVNPITIAAYLAHNDVARAAMTARAEAAVKSAKTDTTALKNYYAAKRELDSLTLPIGWGNGHGMALLQAHSTKTASTKVDSSNAASTKAESSKAESSKIDVWNQIVGPLLGWLLTALAVTLGAPFWFDVLNKVMVIRSTVKPHEKSREEASQDRQSPKSTTIKVDGKADK